MGSRRTLRRGPNRNRARICSWKSWKSGDWSGLCWYAAVATDRRSIESGNTRDVQVESREETQNSFSRLVSCKVSRLERERDAAGSPANNEPIGRLYEELVIRLRRESRVCFWHLHTLQHSCFLSHSFSLFFTRLLSLQWAPSWLPVSQYRQRNGLLSSLDPMAAPNEPTRF